MILLLFTSKDYTGRNIVHCHVKMETPSYKRVYPLDTKIWFWILQNFKQNFESWYNPCGIIPAV